MLGLFPRTRAAPDRPEHELLCCCARAEPTPRTTERIRTLAREPLDWAHLIQAAGWHQIVPLVHRHLESACPDSIPEATRGRLQSLYYAHALRSVRLGKNVLPELLTRLQRHGIPAIPFKGPMLGTLLYNDLSLRSFVDLDLLVRERDVPRVHDLLTAHGYQREASYDFESAYSATIDSFYFEVDVHWQLVDPIHPIHVDYDRLWQRAQPASVAGVATRTLALEDLIIVLGIHGSKHGWARLKWLCDVAEFMRAYTGDVEWGAVIERARAMRCERMLLLGLSLAKDLLDAPLPEDVKRRIEEVAPLQKLEVQVRGNMFSDEPRIFRPNWAARTREKAFPLRDVLYFQRLRDRHHARSDYLELALQAVTPTDNDRAYVALPDTLSFLYYFVRPVRLMSQYGRHWKPILKSLTQRLLARPGRRENAE